MSAESPITAQDYDVEQIRRDFPILYLTGQPPTPADLRLVDGWIQKPFTYDELMEQLREMGPVVQSGEFIAHRQFAHGVVQTRVLQGHGDLFQVVAHQSPHSQ